MKIKIIVLIFSFSFLCFAEQSLEELIDKSDFVNFKKAYEGQNITEEQKAALLDRVNKIIDSTSKPLKAKIGFLLLNWGSILKLHAKFHLIQAVLFLGIGSIGLILIPYGLFLDSKDIVNKYNLTAANFIANALYATYGQYITRRDELINNNKKRYWFIGIPLSFSLFGLFNLYQMRKEKRRCLFISNGKRL